MTTYMAIFAISLFFTVVSTPVARRLALAAGFVDKPSSRKVHRVPVPLLGGVAIWLACLAALFGFTDRFNLPQLGAILLGASIVGIAGLVDDRQGLSPSIKLFAQIGAAVVIVANGVRVESVTTLPAVNYLITFVWLVGITNAMNLLDNMDGLAAGVSAIASAFFLVLAAGSGQYLVASLAAALAGASMGYLRFNFLAPARIFMGDAGSMFLGFLLAALGIKLHFDTAPLFTWLIPILVLGIPLFDTTLVTFSRIRRGVNPLTTPGRDHLSHRLVLAGLTQRESVLVIYMIAGMLGLTGLFLANAGPSEAAIVAATVAGVGLYGLIRLEKVYRASLPAKQPVEFVETLDPAS